MSPIGADVGLMGDLVEPGYLSRSAPGANT
jgi:hypothetical protein